jgi:diguanylate cyclase (GGDEF)-like protein
VALRRVVIVYASAMLALGVAQSLVPHAFAVTRLIGVGTAGAIALGVHRYRPDRALWWFVLAAAVILTAATRLIEETPPPQAESVLAGWDIWSTYAILVTCLGLGALGVYRSHEAEFNALDTVLVILGAALLFVVVVALPGTRVNNGSGLPAPVRLGLGVRDLALVILIVYLAIGVRRSTSVLLTQVGFAGLMLYDLLLRVEWSGSGRAAAALADAGWPVFFVAVGLAALVPSMAADYRPGRGQGAPPSTAPHSRAQLGAVMVAAAMPSIVLLVELLEPANWYRTLMVVASVALLVGMCVRLLHLAVGGYSERQRRAVVRDTVDDLADTGSVTGIASIVEHAIGRLLPPGERFATAMAGAPSGALGDSYPAAVQVEGGDVPEPVAPGAALPGVTLAFPCAGSKGQQNHAEPAATAVVEDRWLYVRASQRSLGQVRDEIGALARQAGLARQRIALNDQAKRRVRDPLTGLGNRRAFNRQLSAVLDQPRNGNRAGVFCVDLDDLRLINEGLGQPAADTILVTAARRLTEFVVDRHGPGDDVVCRVGGEDFALLLSGLPDEAAVERVAEDLTRVLARPTRLGDREVTCTASVGVAVIDEDRTAEEVIRDAELAVEVAGSYGRRQWRVFEPSMRRGLATQVMLRTSFEGAIERDEFFLEYQPIVSLTDRTVAGLEALVRWQHPTLGRLGPGQFVDEAEEWGFITPLGAWVVATASRAAQGWGGTDPYVSVNVSARQFHSSTGFVDTVEHCLAETGLPPARLMLEITENVLLDEEDPVWRELNQLRASGVRIAIDDFGTGYSALSYLRHVSIDVVKLDRSFITPITTSTKQRELVQGIAGIARTLGLTVVAEGIETDAELAAVRDAGCEFGQGYLFSRPLPDRDARRWVDAQVPHTASHGMR